MKKLFQLLLISILTLFSSKLLTAQSNPNFQLASNGVTVTCDAAEIGDSGTVNGVKYTKRTSEQITTSNAATTCTSGIHDMSSLFHKKADFNEDISSWDVGQVVTMQAMFASPFDPGEFNQNIGFWDVRNVTNMRFMFYNAGAFNQDIGRWDVGQVTDMGHMLSNAVVFNQSIEEWDVSKVINMRGMFEFAIAFNQDIGKWNVSQVIDMAFMFLSATSFNQDIGDWDVSGVLNMQAMFNNANAFNQDIGGWDVSQVTDMVYMFGNATSFNQDIGKWNVSQVINMAFMFLNATSFNQDISGWDVSIVGNMGDMFKNADNFNQDIKGWDVSRVTSMAGMFQNAKVFNRDIGGWNVSKVIDMGRMFAGASAFNKNLNGWCVELIPTKPDKFDTDSGFAGQSHVQPQWGKCFKEPETVMLISPKNDSSDISVRPIFEWTESENADGYHFQLSNEEDFSLFIADTTGISKPKIQLANELGSYTEFYWRVRAENDSGVSDWSDTFSFETEMATSIEKETNVPTQFFLAQNYPNPFNPSSTIEFGLAEASEVCLEIFDMIGQRLSILVNEELAAGIHQVQINASNLPSGVYIYRIQAGNFVENRKLTFIK